MSGEEWHEFIQRLLLAFDLSPAQLSEKSGITVRTISRWVKGPVSPQSETIKKLIKAFKCASLSVLQAKVESELRSKRLSAIDEVSQVDPASASPVERQFRLIRFVEEPGHDRLKLLGEYPVFKSKHDALKNTLRAFFDDADDLLVSVTRLEERF